MTTTPQRYRKRPVTIEAAQLTGDTAQWHDIYLWVEANTLGSFEPLDVIASGVSIDPRDGRLIISTLEGLRWADEGDWIIRGVQGEFYPCKDAIFRETYEPAAEHHGEPTDAEIQAAARAMFDVADEQMHLTTTFDLTPDPLADTYRRMARAALLAAREGARHD